ncbi:MAG: hypothetical protein Q4P72_07010 [Eubacteriales bacterium]|nr:hypothetical protein [Eubacteriales bacterium]
MDYADTITTERVKRVIDGYGEGKKAVEGTGGSFSYYELGEPLMVDDNLNPGVSVDRVREYIWFTETGESFTAPTVKGQPYFLGFTHHTAYHFLYEPEQAMTLDYRFLSTLTQETVSDQQVVYADACLLSEQELCRFNITFKKIPRDITHL